METVVLLVRVHADDGEDDRQNGQRRQHDPERHLADTPAVHLDAGPAQLPDPLVGPVALGSAPVTPSVSPFPGTGGSVVVMAIGRA